MSTGQRCDHCLYWCRNTGNFGTCTLCGAHEALSRAIPLVPSEGELMPDETQPAELWTSADFYCNQFESKE